MSRDWRLYLDDMRQACRKVLRYTDGMTIDQLQSNDMAYDAVVRNLEIVGEAAKFLPEHDGPGQPMWIGAESRAYET